MQLNRFRYFVGCVRYKDKDNSKDGVERGGTKKFKSFSSLLFKGVVVVPDIIYVLLIASSTNVGSSVMIPVSVVLEEWTDDLMTNSQHSYKDRDKRSMCRHN